MSGLSHAPPRLLLTGPPKVGKTTVVERLVDLLAEASVPCIGFVSREVRGDDGRRVGFKVRDLAGPETWLAHQDFDSDSRVGRFGVDVAGFERVGLLALKKGQRHMGITVIDEIARMELASPSFVAVVQEIFAGRYPVVATVHIHEHPVTDALKHRKDTDLTVVTQANRDELPGLLFRRLMDSGVVGG